MTIFFDKRCQKLAVSLLAFLGSILGRNFMTPKGEVYIFISFWMSIWMKCVRTVTISVGHITQGSPTVRAGHLGLGFHDFLCFFLWLELFALGLVCLANWSCGIPSIRTVSNLCPFSPLTHALCRHAKEFAKNCAIPFSFKPKASTNGLNATFRSTISQVTHHASKADFPSKGVFNVRYGIRFRPRELVRWGIVLLCDDLAEGFWQQQADTLPGLEVVIAVMQGGRKYAPCSFLKFFF